MSNRALLVWFGILAVAVANGAVREILFVPRLGEGPAHAISVLMLSTAVLIVTWATITWIRPPSSAHAWRIGAFWVALTIAFEFLAGHYLFGAPWSRLLADYNLMRGRIWIVVLLTTLAAPALAARARKLHRPLM